MRDKELRENLKIVNVDDDLWKIPQEHPMNGFLSYLCNKIKENEEEIKKLKEEVNTFDNQEKATLGNQVGIIFELLNKLFKYLGVKYEESWEEDPSYPPPEPKMMKVWRVRKIKKKKK